MKKLITVIAILTIARAAEPVVQSSGDTFPARTLDGSALASVVGELVHGGLGTEKAAAWSGKIVVVDRGTISFAEKVRNAVQAGARAVVVANNMDGPANTGTLSPETAAIPAVTVSKADGEKLKSRAGQQARVGPPVAAAALPDPLGRKGQYLVSDGEKYVLVSAPVTHAISSEVRVGDRLSFSVSADGTPPFTYQWIKDGQNISGATSAVFVIPSATLGDAGSYVCQVTNDKGTAPSQPHNVTVK